MQTQKVTIDTIGGGVAGELFEIELGKVIENILDPNTSPGKAREITIKMKFKPSRDRSVVHTEITCASKLAASVGVESQILVGMDGDQPVANEIVQMSLFGDEEEASEVDKDTGEIIRFGGRKS